MNDAYRHYGSLTQREIAQLGYAVGRSIRFIIQNHADIERIADTFTHGDLEDAFALILERGLYGYVLLCDLDCESKEAKE